MPNTFDKTLDICGLCKYWSRIKIGCDSGICSKSKKTCLFYYCACDKFEPFESDPNGLKAKDAGAKLDTGKIRADLLEDFSPGLLKIATICDYGAKKYSVKGWLKVQDAQTRYKAAFWRHLLAGEGIDPESGLPHTWHCAWNLLAMLSLSDD